MITEHEVRVYLTVTSDPHRWWTSQEVATRSGVAARTVRAHLKRLVEEGFVEMSNTHPAHRYKERWDSPMCHGYKEEIYRLAEVYGIDT